MICSTIAVGFIAQNLSPGGYRCYIITTRARETDIFRHILINVLNLKETDQLWVALSDSGYDSITDLATLTEVEIEKLLI